jgi:GMP synthase-like glutamine amidotransferase
MKPKVLILDGSVHNDIYRPTDEWRQLLGHVPADTVHLPSGQTLPSIADYSHIIVTGSEASIVEPAPWYEVEAAAIRTAAEMNRPILASCFGHQMLAKVLSGDQYVARSTTPEVGWIELEFVADDELFIGLPNPLHVFTSHFDEVPGPPPPPWRVLARNDRCAVHIMRYGDKPIWGIQSHPEIPPDHAVTLMKGIVKYFPDKTEIATAALNSKPRDDNAAREIVRRFLAHTPQ